MCGIAGKFGGEPASQPTLEKTLKLMHQRGPDFSQATQVWDSKHSVSTQLLHSRLRIIDLNERANQPFSFGSRTLVFNGEIYNYIEVRKSLAALGHHFETSSDTEVLIHALAEWGTAGLERLEGMWAFAMHDRTDGSLILSRDRFGEKPLYFRVGSKVCPSAE